MCAACVAALAQAHDACVFIQIYDIYTRSERIPSFIQVMKRSQFKAFAFAKFLCKATAIINLWSASPLLLLPLRQRANCAV